MNLALENDFDGQNRVLYYLGIPESALLTFPLLYIDTLLTNPSRL